MAFLVVSAATGLQYAPLAKIVWIQCDAFRDRIRCHRDRRRPCRHRGRAGGGAHGQAHAAADPQHRDARADELQSGHRRHRQGPPGQGDRCARAAPWRSRPTRPASSSARSMPARDRRCAPPAPKPTANSTSAPSAARLETQPNLTLFQQEAADLIVAGRPRRRASSPRAASNFARARIVLTVGTFLGGRIHVGSGESCRRPRRRSAVADVWRRACAS